MTRFKVIHVGEDRIDETLPLVRMALPLLSADRWRRLVQSAGEDGRGVLAAYAPDGRPHGVAVYRPEDSLIGGRTLHVEPIITFEINRSAPTRAALCQALELLGLAKGCDRLLVAMPSRGYADPRCAKADAWAQLGMEVASVGLIKHLDPRRSSSPEARARFGAFGPGLRPRSALR